MGRLVESTVVRSGGQLAAESGEGDTYLVRIAKYVPSEIVAGYVAINGFSLSAAEPQQLPIWIANFGLCLCLTPIYLARQASSGQPKAVHLVVASAAFLVWAYAVGGSSGIFGTNALNWYHASLSSILLVAFTLVSGAIVPQKKQD